MRPIFVGHRVQFTRQYLHISICLSNFINFLRYKLRSNWCAPRTSLQGTMRVHYNHGRAVVCRPQVQDLWQIPHALQYILSRVSMSEPNLPRTARVCDPLVNHYRQRTNNEPILSNFHQRSVYTCLRVMSSEDYSRCWEQWVVRLC